MTLRLEVPGEKIVNAEQCKCNNNNAHPEPKDMSLGKRLKQFIKSSWEFRKKITVEPFIICYLLPSVISGLAVQNLCLEKSCLVNLHYDSNTCLSIMHGRSHNYTEEEKNVQIMVAGMTAWSFPLQTAVSGILTLFVGAWSDRTGNRKTFMILPILGKLISIIGIIFSTVFFYQVGLNETALLEGLPPALAGGRTAMTTAVYSYVADITSDTERTFRLGIITAIITLTRPVGLALSGIMTSTFGYYGVFIIACAFYLTGFVYIVLRLRDRGKVQKSVEKKEPSTIWSMFSFQDLVATVTVAFRTREGCKRMQIILIMFAYMLVVGPVLGEAQMTYWFTRYKFKFNEIDYSFFLTYSVLVGSVGSFITIYLFSKKWKMNDSLIGVVACASRVAASVVYALAPTRTIYFLGPVMDMFSSAAATSLRSIITKLVDPDEVGKATSLISISEALIPVIYSPVYSKLYLATLSWFSGAFYLISASLALPASVIFLIMYRMNKSDSAKSTPEEQTEPEHRNCKEITRF